MIRWRRLSRAATAPSWYNSTNAAGGNSPVLTVAECRRAARKFPSSLELAKLLAFNSTRRELPMDCIIAHTRTMLQTTYHRGSSNYTFHVKWAHNKAKTLGSSQGYCGSSKGFFSLRLLILWREFLEAISSSPGQKPNFCLGQGVRAVLSSPRRTWPLWRSPYPLS